MLLGDIPIRHGRALIIDPMSAAGWQTLTNSYVQARLMASGIQSDRFAVAAEGFRANIELFTSSFIELLRQAPDKYDFVFTVNRIPSNLLRLDEGAEHTEVYDYAGVPIVTWLVDNIGHHCRFIDERPFKREMFLVADGSSVNTGNALGHSLTKDSFLSMWGAARPDVLPRGAPRDIPVLFSGDVWKAEPVADLRERVAKGDEDIARIFDRVLEQMIDDKGRIDALSLAIDECKKIERLDRAVDVFHHLDPWLRRRRRKKLLQRFKKTTIRICGRIEDEELAAQDNLQALGLIHMNDTVRLAQHSQMFLGEFANFVGGVELRPSIAMANGAVLVCEPNTYFSETFNPNMYIDVSDESVTGDDAIAEYLENPEKLTEIDERAGRKYASMRVRPLPFSKDRGEAAPKRIFRT